MNKTTFHKMGGILLLLLFFCIANGFAQLSDLHYLPPLKQKGTQAIDQQAVYLSTPETSAFTVNIYQGTNTTPIESILLSNGAPYMYSPANGNNDVTLVTDANTGVVLSNSGLRFESPGGQQFYVNYRAVSGAQGTSLTSKGRAAMGTNFYWGGIPQMRQSAYVTTTMGIMATEDNTTITISGYDPAVTFRQGVDEYGLTDDQITVTLNANQSYVLETAPELNAANMAGWLGASVVSDKPIVMSNGGLNYSVTNVDSRDAGIDQPVPTSLLGKEYVFVRGAGSDILEFAIIVATQNNTAIYVNGNATPVATLDAGEYFRVDGTNYSGTVAGSNMFVTASKNVYAYQNLAGSNSEVSVGMNFVAPVNCLLPSVVDNIPNITDAAGTAFTGGVTIIASTSTDDADIVVQDGNGTVTKPASQAVTGTIDWKTFYISGLTGDVSVHSTGSIAVGFFGLSGSRGIAGYYSGFDNISDVSVAITGDVCLPGASLSVTNDTYESYQWFGNGVAIAGATAATYSPTEAGDYYVRVSKSSCSYDSQPLTVYYCNPDIQVTNTVSDNDLADGDTTTFTVKVQNWSNDPITNLELTDALPAGMSFVSATTTKGTFTYPTWDVGTLNSGELATLEVLAQADYVVGNDNSVQNLTSTVSHTQDQTDSNITADQLSVALTVTNSALRNLPSFTTSDAISYVENETAAINIDANDGDGGAADENITYSLTGGADMARFNLNAQTGELTFKVSPDYENPADADGDNYYEISVTATDGDGSALLDLLVRVTSQFPAAPGGISTDLSLWLKADSGFRPAQWNDESAFGHNVVQASTNLQPALKTNGINFNPTVVFDGSDLMQTGAGVMTSSELVDATSNNANSQFIVFKSTGASGTIYNYSNTPGGSYATGANTNGNLFLTNQVGSSGAVTNDIAYLRVLRGNNITATVRAEGAFAANVGGSAAPLYDGVFNLGSEGSNGLYPFTGEIAEIINYREDVAVDINRIESYLALKYGISLSQASENDYVDSDGAVVWDASANTGYDADIFGIGRDDASRLDQKVSKSMNSGAILTMALDNDFTSANTDAGRTTEHTNDKQFLVAANNGAATSMQYTEIDGTTYNVRISREWKVDNTNFSQSINLKFDGFNETWTLLKDADGDFSSGATSLGTLDANGELAGVTLADGDYFTLAKLQEAPGGVFANLQLWLSADDNGTTTTNNAVVSTWYNKGIAANGDFTIGNHDPTYSDDPANRLNFNPVINFDGEDFFTNTDSNFGLDGLEVHAYSVIGKFTGNGGVSDQHGFFAPNGVVDPPINGLEFTMYDPNDGLRLNLFGTTGIVEEIINRDRPNILGVSRSSSGVGSSYVNGTSNTGSTNSTPWNSSVRYYVGASDRNAVLQGTMPEILVYDRELSPAERQRVESYLALKYGMTLDQTSPSNYVASNAAVIWDATTNTGYKTDIFGIGRDDASGLNQKVSKSVNSGSILTMALDNDFTSANNDAARTTTHTNDRQFLMIANNGGAVTEQDTEIETSSFNTRITREWKVDKTANFSQQVQLKFAGFDGDWSLITSTDGDFSSNITILGALDANGEITDVSLADGQYFTLATTKTLPPSITSFSPKVGGNGDTITILGTGFTGTTQVAFEGTDALSFTVVSDTELKAVVGSGASGSITVTNPEGNDSETGFTYKVAQYDFEGNVLDATDSNNDGTEVNTVTYGTGAQGQAICFDGAPGYVKLPDNLIHSLSTFTISLRFKTTGTGSILGYQNYPYSTAPSNYIPILMITKSGYLKGTLWTNEGSPIRATSSATVNDGNWHRVDFVGGEDYVEIYLDGNKEASTSGPKVAHLDMAFNQLGLAYTATYDDVDTTWEFFNGCIDDLVILDRSLSSAAIEELTAIPDPAITSFSPTEGGEEDTVVITGTHLNNATQVTIGGQNVASFTVDSDTQITAHLGTTGTSGQVAVTTAGGTGVLDGFTFMTKTDLVLSEGSLSGMLYCPGAVSAAQSFTIAGTNLYNDITVIAPTGFEVSLNETSGYATSLTLSPTDHQVAETTIYARVASGQNGPVNGEITLVSGTASVAKDVFGGNNNALSFDGVNDYVQLSGSNIQDGATDFTIETWILPDASNFDGAFHAIIGYQDPAGNGSTRNPSFYLHEHNVHVDMYEDETLTRYDFLTTGSEVKEGVWTHMALVKEGLEYRFYVNGALILTRSAPAKININGPYQLGYIDNYFAGKLDELRFWDIPRTQQQIEDNMNVTLQGNETGLVGYYTFNQGTAQGSNPGETTLYDASDLELNGTLNNMALTGTNSNWVEGYFAQITGANTVEMGATLQLGHAQDGGTWSSSDTDVATVNATTGLVTSVSTGTVTISYSLCNATTQKEITVEDTTAPTGYTVSIDQEQVNTSNQTNVGFTFANAEVGATYYYSFTSDGGGKALNGTGTIATATDQISGINLSGLPAGTLTLSVTLKDASNNTGVAATDTVVKGNLPQFTAPNANYNVSSAVYMGAGKSFTVANEMNNSFGITFSTDGSLLFVSTYDRKIFSYTLSTPFDVSTGVFRNFLTVSGRSQGIAFNNDGTKFYHVGNSGNGVKEYTMTTPYDIPNAALNQNFAATEAGGNFEGIAFNGDGTKMFLLGSSGSDSVFEYTLSTPFNVGTATLAHSLPTPLERANDFAFNGDGTKLFVLGFDLGISQYDLSSAYDLSTAVYAGPEAGFDPDGVEDDPYGMTFGDGGSKMFIIGYDLKVYAFSMMQSTVEYAENNTDPVIDVQANDADGGGTDENITYTLASGGDNDLFTIDASTGVLSFNDAPDFEDPQDADTNNVYELTITATDTNGSTDLALQLTVTDVDEVAPTGYTVSIDQTLVTSANMDAVSFTFANAEVGATYYYSFTSDGGGKAVNGTGTIATATDQITGINLTGLPVGNLTLSVTLTDTAGNEGDPVTDTVQKGNLPVFTQPKGGYNVAQAVYAGSDEELNVGDQDPYPMSMTFSADGSILFVLGGMNDAVNRYDLDVPFDVSTATYVNNYKVSSQEYFSSDVTFNNDGTKMFVVGYNGDAVVEYHLATPYDLTTVTYAGAEEEFSVANEEQNIMGIAFNTDGTKMFIVGTISDSVYEYHLTTGFDVSTASFAQSISVAAQEYVTNDLTFSADGSKMFILGSGTKKVYQYDLATPFDIGTAVWAGPKQLISVYTEETNPMNVAFNNDGSKMYVLGQGETFIVEYNIAPSVFYQENGTEAVVDVQANDGDGGNADENITYSLASGGDNDLFTIDGSTGVLSFNDSPDYETPQDADADNVYELTVSAVDGNGTTEMLLTVTVTDYDEIAPSGYSVTFDQANITDANADSGSFTLANAEVGTTYEYSISSDGGGTPVSGSGTIATATDQISGIDLSSLSDGTLTVSITLTDANGNEGTPVTDTVNKDTATETPVLVKPATNGVSGATVDVAFTLPEAPKAGSVKLVFSAAGDPNSPISLVLDDAGITAESEKSFSIDPWNLSAAAQVVSASSTTLKSGTTYAVTLSYQDALDNPVASTAHTGYKVEELAISDFTIYSNNGNTEWAKEGDNVIMEFTFNHHPDAISLNVLGNALTVDDSDLIDADTYRVSVTVGASTTEGEVAFLLTANPSTENLQLSTTTDSSKVTVDTTAPVPSLVIDKSLYFGPFTMQLQFSEPVINMAPHPVIVAPGEGGDPTASLGDPAVVTAGEVYSIAVTPSEVGELVFFNENEGIAQDRAGNYAKALGTVSGTFYDLDTDNDGIGNQTDTDDDGDGTPDTEDAFPLDPAEDTDTDGDGTGDNADLDDDGDGTPDAEDAFPKDASEDTDTDGDGTGDNADLDDDGDGTPDAEDAFPKDAFEDTDTDGDGTGDNADLDDDGDGTPDAEDAFPKDASEDTDTDGDGIGNNTDNDDDGDGVNDDQDDFPLDPDENFDMDGDGIGDNADTDIDGDGIPNDEDVYPYGEEQDADNDGVPDSQDAFPNDPNESVDSDGDGIGDNEDPDDDNDGVSDEEDAFPYDAAESEDTDGDGVGNNADADDDGDGTPDAEDAFPWDASESVDTDGDGIGNNADTDDDNDGVPDGMDAFPGVSEPMLVPAQAFTPNGDGVNDAWVVPGIDNYPMNVVRVYNKWGHEVFMTQHYKNDWTGTSRGNAILPPGSYLYIIDLGNGTKPLQGWIFLNY